MITVGQLFEMLQRQSANRGVEIDIAEVTITAVRIPFDDNERILLLTEDSTD